MSLLDSPHFKILVDLIPKYDGTKKLLNFYIREVENVLEQIEVAGRNHPTLLSVIKSKLSGAAVEAIAYETNLDTWNNIKTALIRRLGEPRNEIQVMQELTRSRKFKNENAESFGKRLRELLDTLLSIGNHANKGYYEEMVIEQYVNNLDFHVSLGVRIAKPDTLEMAIVAARQEEARLALNKPGPSTFYNGTFRQKEPNFPQHSHNNRLPFPSRLHLPPTHPQFRPDNYVPQENNMTPEQRQQLVKSLLPWKNQQGGRSSGNFRKPLNIPQQGHHAHKNSDVTMRSVSKPQKPPYLIEEVFYTENNPYNSDPEFQGTCYNCYNSLQDESDVEPNSCQEEAEYNPDFHEAQGEEDRR
ncbi:unnamed protein product [Pieris brassicae]|uniref:Retrotransposon gag domain-containing protein n=1 Tax=Pieris brassicae TaxID=7116 RepID=A0A9P0TRH7_PIEBR|nr:unnamed protein product [Pieris brassicae]